MYHKQAVEALEVAAITHELHCTGRIRHTLNSDIGNRQAMVLK